MLLYTNITINVNFGLIAILVYKNMYLISFIKSMVVKRTINVAYPYLIILLEYKLF